MAFGGWRYLSFSRALTVFQRRHAGLASEGGGKIKRIPKAAAKGDLPDRKGGFEPKQILGPFHPHSVQIPQGGHRGMLLEEAAKVIGMVAEGADAFGHVEVRIFNILTQNAAKGLHRLRLGKRGGGAPNGKAKRLAQLLKEQGGIRIAPLVLHTGNDMVKRKNGAVNIAHNGRRLRRIQMLELGTKIAEWRIRDRPVLDIRRDDDQLPRLHPIAPKRRDGGSRRIQLIDHLPLGMHMHLAGKDGSTRLFRDGEIDSKHLLRYALILSRKVRFVNIPLDAVAPGIPPKGEKGGVSLRIQSHR